MVEPFLSLKEAELATKSRLSANDPKVDIAVSSAGT